MRIQAFVSILLLLAGCSGGAPVAPSLSGTAARAAFAATCRPGNLYVANYDNNTVTVYKAKTPTLLRTIKHVFTGAFPKPWLLAVDRACNVYAAGSYSNEIVAYAPGATRPSWTIPNICCPNAMAIDKAGNLYVANHEGPGAVLVFSPGKTTPLRTISAGVWLPQALAFDGSGNLYVANTPGGSSKRSTVTVYAPNGTTPVRTITKGVSYPAALACDAAGNLYVGNNAGVLSESTISVYAKGGSTPARVIKNAAAGGPQGLAFDAKGNLYVADYHATGSVLVFAPGGAKPVRTISTASMGAYAIAFDDAGNLYVASLFQPDPAGRVYVFAPKSGKLAYSIKAGIDGPAALAFGP